MDDPEPLDEPADPLLEAAETILFEPFDEPPRDPFDVLLEPFDEPPLVPLELVPLDEVDPFDELAPFEFDPLPLLEDLLFPS